MSGIKKAILGLFCYFWFLPLGAASKIQLLPHQQKPVDYLMQHSDVKGLLLYHSMGSGKTYISLAFCEKFPEKKVLVIAPRFLKSNWSIQTKEYGVTDPARYRFLSYEEASETIQNMDLKNTIVIIDEVHKFIELIRKAVKLNDPYTKMYFRLLESHRILALSGTPLYSHASDLSYTLNLVSGKMSLPVEEQEFRLNFMKVKTNASSFRGYFLESKWNDDRFPIIALAVSALLLPPNLIVFGFIGGATLLPLTRGALPLNQFELREFDTERLKPETSKYISYYNVDFEHDDNYPRREMVQNSVPYSEPQLHMFLRYADQKLSQEQMYALLSEKEDHINKEQLKLHSDTLQAEFKKDSGGGRDIGNLTIDSIETPKFPMVYGALKNSTGPSVIYSNYYNNGIKLFAKFLDKMGEKNYRILSPDLSFDEQVKIINDYNKGNIKILLLHPEITEGVSLEGTDQLHILEPIINIALQEQIIGRTIRYRSHTHLPKERQIVHIYVWNSKVDYGRFYNLYMTRDSFVRRQYHLDNYPEINENLWTKGVLEVDVNYHRKDLSPDEIVLKQMNAMSDDAENFRSLVENHSIEKSQ